MERNPMADWTPILHRDTKLSNIFLGLPGERNYSGYPVPKLGDFGLAIYLPDGSIDDYDAQGTWANMPVEQNPEWLWERGLNWPLTSKANVWAIGNVVGSLFVQEEGILDFRVENAGTDPEFHPADADHYSESLRNLISDCMRFDPVDRPDLTQVLRAIRNHKSSAQAVSLQHEPPDGVAWNRHRLNPAVLDLDEQKRIYQLDDASDIDTLAHVGGETGTELRKNGVTGRSPEKGNLVNGSRIKRLRVRPRPQHQPVQQQPSQQLPVQHQPAQPQPVQQQPPQQQPPQQQPPQQPAPQQQPQVVITAASTRSRRKVFEGKYPA